MQDKLDDAAAQYRDAIRLDLEEAVADPLNGVDIPQTANEAGSSQAMLRDRQFAAVHGNLGDIFFIQGKLDDAATEDREAIRSNPSDAIAHFNFGLLLYTQAMIAAETEFPAAVWLDQKLETAHATLHTLGKLDDAAAEYREANLLGTKNLNSHFYLASIMLELGRLDAAATEYREAINFRFDETIRFEY
jgi:tetratricopeptide (TPR) repeat protein